MFHMCCTCVAHVCTYMHMSLADGDLHSVAMEALLELTAAAPSSPPVSIRDSLRPDLQWIKVRTWIVQGIGSDNSKEHSVSGF